MGKEKRKGVSRTRTLQKSAVKIPSATRVPSALRASKSGPVRYGGETVPPGGADECDLVLVEDPDRLRRLLVQAGADPERDISSKIVLPGRVRLVVAWFDAEAPASSSTRAAEHAASLRADGERVRLRLDLVGAVHRQRIVLEVARNVHASSFVGSRGVRRGEQPEPEEPLPPIVFYTAGSAAAGGELERLAGTVARAADLENEPSNFLGPPELALAVRRWFEDDESPAVRARVKVSVLDKRALERLGMGLVLGVGRGGEKPPCMILLECIGGRAPLGPPSRGRRRPLVALVGKGVTYDAGGMAIKPGGSMYGMHGDKSGAAVAAAVMRHLVAGSETLPYDLVALLPAVENLVSERAVRPGDVLTAYSGATVEVVNPDAEGRLIMADAMAFAGDRYRPDVVVDFATLTGTSQSVHPDATAVFYAESDAVSAQVQAAGEATGERVWRMPPWGEYAYHTDSPVANARNDGWSSPAGGYMAAMFLRRFVPSSCGPAAWVHVDIGRNALDSASSAGPFVGAGVALGVRIVEALGAGAAGGLKPSSSPPKIAGYKAHSTPLPATFERSPSSH